MAQSSPDRPLTALVVEDETLVRMETADLLGDAGFLVLEAWNAATALRQLERSPEIRLLVTDVQMPGALDGFALAREVARQRPDIRIVVVSAIAEPSPEALPPGARFVGKPFSARLVLETLNAMNAGLRS